MRKPLLPRRCRKCHRNISIHLRESSRTVKPHCKSKGCPWCEKCAPPNPVLTERS